MRDTDLLGIIQLGLDILHYRRILTSTPSLWPPASHRNRTAVRERMDCRDGMALRHVHLPRRIRAMVSVHVHAPLYGQSLGLVSRW